MKIAVVHSFYRTDQPSGENSVVLDQVVQLRRVGHEVLLVERHSDELMSTSRSKVRAAGTTAIGRGPSPNEVLARFDPDVVHLHNTFPNWGTTWLREWGQRTVVTMHNYRSMCSNGLLFRDGVPCHDCLRTPVWPAVRHRCYRGSAAASLPLAIGSSPIGGLRRVPRQCARVIALNEQAARTFSSLLKRHVDVVPNFVRSEVAVRTDARGERWVCVGRLTEEKGVSGLVQQWPENVHLDIVGDGPVGAEIDHLIRDRGDIRRLGLMDRHDLLVRLGHYQGIVVPSLVGEGLPTVILEALACGVPSVLSRHIHSAPSLASEGVAAVYDPDGGTRAVASALSAVIGAGAAMRRTAVDLHRRLYSPTAWQEKMDPIYSSIARP